MNKIKKPKIGLALGSGGAKGLSHIGVIKMLEKHHIPIDMIAGSSIGSLVGAYYAVHKDTKKLEEVALSFNRKKGFSLFDPTLKGGIIKGNKIENLISEMLGNSTFEKLDIPFAAVATDYNTAEPVILKSGELKKAIRASISVPTFFQPVLLHDRLLADGGLSDPVPVDTVREMGADIVIAINLDTLFVENPLTSLPSLSKIPFHSINILRHNLSLHATKTADIVIAPKVMYQMGLIGWNELFDTEKAQSIIASGETAAEAVIEHIHEQMNNFEKNQQKRGIFSFFKKIFK